MPHSTTLIKALMNSVALTLASIACSGEMQSTDSPGTPDTILENFRHITEGNDHFFILCDYKDRNKYEGMVLFIESNGLYYYIEIDKSSYAPLQIVAFKKTKKYISLSPHWGGNGSGDRIRKFILDNEPLLDGQWIFGNPSEYISRNKNEQIYKCIPPEI